MRRKGPHLSYFSSSSFFYCCVRFSSTNCFQMRLHSIQMNVNFAVISLLLMGFAPWSIYSVEDRLLVNMTLVRGAEAAGAVCLDGSLPAYHWDRGFGSGADNWLLQFEVISIGKWSKCLHPSHGGGWCNDIRSCAERAQTRHGSTDYMNKFEVFSGILSNNALQNPDFYNWNRVKLRYCDGASFAGDSKFYNGTTSLYFRGQRIWKAIILDLLPKGLNSARKALLSGCSAGGLATFLHCDNFASFLPENAHVKCLSDAGFFLDICDIAGNSTMRSFYDSLVTVQGVLQNLNENCSSSHYFPSQCFFPQYALPYIQTPYFILNSAYDVFQFHHALVPPSADPHGHWRHCSLNPAACTPYQIAILQGLRYHMLIALRKFELLGVGGMFINSCFAHCQSESQDTWLAPNSPRVHNKTIAQAVGDWYFGRNITKEIDCPYPCDKTCHNLIP